MTANEKGRAGWHQTAPETSKSTDYFTGFNHCIKGLIITLALWGWTNTSGGLADSPGRAGG